MNESPAPIPPVVDLRASLARLNRRAQLAESVLQALVAYADSIRPFGSDPFLAIVDKARAALENKA